MLRVRVLVAIYLVLALFVGCSGYNEAMNNEVMGMDDEMDLGMMKTSGDAMAQDLLVDDDDNAYEANSVDSLYQDQQNDEQTNDVDNNDDEEEESNLHQQTFTSPKYNGKPVCASPNDPRRPPQPEANAFCISQQFQKASKFQLKVGRVPCFVYYQNRWRFDGGGDPSHFYSITCVKPKPNKPLPSPRNVVLPTNVYTQECTSAGDPHTWTFNRNSGGARQYHHAQGNGWYYAVTTCKGSNDLGFSIQVWNLQSSARYKVSIVRGVRVIIPGATVTATYQAHATAGTKYGSNGNAIVTARHGYWTIIQVYIDNVIVAQVRFANGQLRVQIRQGLNSRACGFCGSELQLCNGKKLNGALTRQWSFTPTQYSRVLSELLATSYKVGSGCPTVPIPKPPPINHHSHQCRRARAHYSRVCRNYYNSYCVCRNGNQQSDVGNWVNQCALDVTTQTRCRVQSIPKPDTKPSPAAEKIRECKQMCAQPPKPIPPFQATLGARNGVPSRKYKFRVVRTNAKSGTFSSVMIAECKKLGSGWKPVCDHPLYCRNDRNSIYLGQSHHIAYAPHRKYAGYFPSGWAQIQNNWDGLCSYTARANGVHALCNFPRNTHSWQRPQPGWGFVCAKTKPVPPPQPFTATLGAPAGGLKAKYRFVPVVVKQSGGQFSAVMVAGCKKLGSGYLPVCDHPSYCKNDGNAIYLGQQHHIALPAHRNSLRYFPSGWNTIKNKWNGFCSYCGRANRGHALCNIPSNTHSWRSPAKGYLYMCAKILKQFLPKPFTAILGASAHIPKRKYRFVPVVVKQTGGQFSALMVAGCKKLGSGYLPVCDHPSYCKNDGNAIYLGQQHHIALPAHRNNVRYFPSGWNAIKNKWNGFCSYCARANRGHALCNIPINTHSWRSPTRGYLYMCAKIVKQYVPKPPAKFKATLGARNGVPSRTYKFAPTQVGGSFASQMIAGCKKHGKKWKPVCDHPSYCKNDPNAIYLGQSYHISHPSHRNNAAYFPSGWPAIKDKWNGFCNYAANVAQGRALCNYPRNTHSWQYANKPWWYMCAKIVKSRDDSEQQEIENDDDDDDIDDEEAENDEGDDIDHQTDMAEEK